jgi:hypothetical protein
VQQCFGITVIDTNVHTLSALPLFLLINQKMFQLFKEETNADEEWLSILKSKFINSTFQHQHQHAHLQSHSCFEK